MCRGEPLLEADDGAAFRCRILLEGVVMALPVLSHLECCKEP
jgi:hypothetical protein